MPIDSASSGMVMPGRAFTSSSAWMARVPEPFGRPRRPVPLLFARALRARRGAVAVDAARGLGVPTPESACSAASRRWYSSTSGRSSFSRAEISLRFSSRKSGTQQTLPKNRLLT